MLYLKLIIRNIIIHINCDSLKETETKKKKQFN
jgi:hypothetical protein